MWKQFIKQYLDFSRRERNGIYLLLALIVVCWAVPHLIPHHFNKDPAADKAFAAEVSAFSASLSAEADAAPPASSSFAASKTPAHLFYFDPNTLSIDGWVQLGVKERTAQTIQHYLEKGGHFRKAEDLSKIYGLPPAQSEALAPYVRIAETVSDRNNNTTYGNAPRFNEGAFPKRDSSAFAWGKRDSSAFTPYKRKAFTPTDINAADSVRWMQLPGIGPSLAGRIVHYRDRLGGFYAAAQVGETFGLPDSTFKKIQPFLQLSGNSLKKIDLNQADEKTLAAHPYIRYSLAKLIIRYRNSHGSFDDVADLKKIVTINDSIYHQIEHYLSTPKP